jgi:hypothetical protein
MQICDIAVAPRRPPVATKPISRTALWGEVDRNELIRVNSEAKRPDVATYLAHKIPHLSLLF